MSDSNQTLSGLSRRHSQLSANSMFIVGFISLAWLASANLTTYGQSLEEGLAPGLEVEFHDDRGNSTRYISPNANLDLRLNGSASDLAGHVKRVTLSGLWLPDGAGDYRWWMSGHGNFKIWVGDNIVAEVSLRDDSNSETKPFTVSNDWQPIRIVGTFEDLRGRLSVSTSSPSFQPEPLSPLRLAHDELDSEIDQITVGRALVESLRCAACHQLETSPWIEPAPRLMGERPLPHDDWLRAWLTSHSTVSPSDHVDKGKARGLDEVSSLMPSFHLTSTDIEDLLAFLKQRAEAQSQPEDKLAEDADDAGRKLFHQVGCQACHTLSSKERVRLTDGPRLDNIGAKRSHEELLRWLEDPKLLDAKARMPKVQLSKEERESLAIFLQRQRTSTDSPRIDQVPRPDRGKELFAQFRCNACHDDAKANNQQAIPLTDDVLNEDGSTCLSGPGGDSPRAAYNLNDEQRAAVLSYLTLISKAKKGNGITAQHGEEPTLAAERRIRQLGCMNCHPRNFGRGITTRLEQSQAEFSQLRLDPVLVKPPGLNGIGDKLTDEAWEHILGKGLKRRDWLTVRMPTYDLNDDEIAEIAAHFRSIDRQANGAAAAPVNVTDQEAMVAGARLVTSEGFGCMSCHAVADHRPIGAQPHTLGPSLSAIDRWVQREWFDRWVRAPARITPMMEMPSVQIPLDGVLENDLDRQLAALWQAINQPEFDPPRANPVRIVRHTGRGVNRPATVVTDVMRIDGRAYTKPFTVALTNRHTVMFDLETGRFSAWWIGDAARQYTEGKSWFWEPGGAMLISARGDQPEWSIESEGNWVTPVRTGQFTTEARQWQHSVGGVRFDMPLQFGDDNQPRQLQAQQEIRPLSIEDTTSESGLRGFRRLVTIAGLAPRQRVRMSMEHLLSQGIEIDTPDQEVIEVAEPLPWRLSIASKNGSLDAENGHVQFQADKAGELKIQLDYVTPLPSDRYVPVEQADPPKPSREPPIVVPGFTTETLPIRGDWMPTALAWSPSGTMYLASLKGRIWQLKDQDGDSLEDIANPIGDELAAPFGLYATDDYVDVINKFALLRMRDSDGNGHFESVESLASGWGHTTDYHDWAVGLPHDGKGGYWIALPCQQDNRSLAASRYRGEVLHLQPREKAGSSETRFSIEPVSGGHRFPMGLARRSDGLLVVTDNQGNYNPFNELNHVVAGKRFGFINAWEKKQGKSFELTSPAISIPHPWTRSVNGICFLESPDPADSEAVSFGPFEGHLIGCEYDTRGLVRMSVEMVDGQLQGAAYPFSLNEEAAQKQLLGPLTCHVSPRGELYVGGIRDSGWGGANNIGTLLRLRLNRETLPCGIAEVTAIPEGLRIKLTRAIEVQRAKNPARYRIESYTRIPTPQYGGPDVERRTEPISIIKISEDRTTVELRLKNNLREGFVYEISLQPLVDDEQAFFPAEAYYTMNRAPNE